MAKGRLHIKRLGNPDNTSDVYEVIFEDLAGDTYTASMSRAEVDDLLHNKLALTLDDETLHECLDELDRNGRVMIENLRVSDSNLAGAGLLHLPFEG